MKLFRLTLFLLSVALSSCIGEDRDNCSSENNLILRFSYVIDSGDELFVSRVEQTEVFIFDESGCLLRQETIGTSSLDAAQSVGLTLSPGTYRVVCWGNMLEKTGVCPLSSSTRIEDAFIYNTTLQGGSATNCDPLYYSPGSAADALAGYYFTVPPTGSVTKTLDFTCAHIKLQVFISGFTDPEGSGGNLPPVVQVGALETNGDFSMRPFGTVCNYSQPSAYQNISGAEMATAYFNLPPFKDDNSLKLHIKKVSDGSTVTSVIIKDYMAANGLSVENIEEAVIPIHITYGGTQNVDVSIGLPTWNDSPVVPEL